MNSEQIISIFVFVMVIITVSYWFGKSGQERVFVRDLNKKLIEQRQEIRNLIEIGEKLSRYSWHSASCVKRSPFCSPNDVCDCGYEQALTAINSMHEEFGRKGEE